MILVLYKALKLGKYYYAGILIGFRNSFEMVIEGDEKDVCVEVKREGLSLDPFDYVTFSIQKNLGK